MIQKNQTFLRFSPTVILINDRIPSLSVEITSKRHVFDITVENVVIVSASCKYVLQYRTRAKIRASLFKTHAVLGRAYFRKMLIFELCLFKSSINFEALFFKMYHIFWLISMCSRYDYGSNIPLKYTVMLWYLQLYLKNKFPCFQSFKCNF